MAGLKWMTVLAVTVAIVGCIQLASAAPGAQRDNSLDDLNPLSIEVCFLLLLVVLVYRKWAISNSDHCAMDASFIKFVKK